MSSKAIQQPGLKFIYIAVTYTADAFQGIYHGKTLHDEDFTHVIHRAKSMGCEKIILTSMTLTGARPNVEVCRQYPGVCFTTIGVHPYHADELNDAPSQLEDLTSLATSLRDNQGSSVVAFGEIGLDYFYLNKASKEEQRKAFVDQLEIAASLDLPLFLHVRDSYSDFKTIIELYLSRFSKKGVVHCFAGTREEMSGLVVMGFDISIAGVCFNTEEQQQMIRMIPMDRLQVETDAPWCEIPSNDLTRKRLQDASPPPSSRKPKSFVAGEMVKGRNESCTIGHVAHIVAGLKGVPVAEIAAAAWRNSNAMFFQKDK